MVIAGWTEYFYSLLGEFGLLALFRRWGQATLESDGGICLISFSLALSCESHPQIFLQKQPEHCVTMYLGQAQTNWRWRSHHTLCILFTIMLCLGPKSILPICIFLQILFLFSQTPFVTGNHGFSFCGRGPEVLGTPSPCPPPPTPVLHSWSHLPQLLT